jgi:LacI family transcriptional regulator
MFHNFSPGPEGRSLRSSHSREARTIRCEMVVHARESLASRVLNAISGITAPAVSLHAVASRSDQETLELIGTLGRQADVFGLLGKSSQQVNVALAALRGFGIHVIAFLSDLDPGARSTYIGGDNRAAGQVAALIIGRCLERGAEAAVVLITSDLSYRAWEQREIGFRSLLRSRFSGIKIIEVMTRNDLAGPSCGQLVAALRGIPVMGAIYNVTGENQAVAGALGEIPLSRRPLYITHELDGTSEPLLRSGMIDFLIVENLETAAEIASRMLIDLQSGNSPSGKAALVPIELLSRFNLDSGRRS